MEEIIKLQNEYEYGGIIFLIHDDGIRRNVAYLDDDERELMINAIIALNTDNKYGYSGERDDPIVGGVSYWFKQDEIHQATHVHGGPAFLPWHRELCNRFEQLLRKYDDRLRLHYWDWTTDPLKSPDGKGGTVNLFTDKFMGNATGPVEEPLLSAGFYDPKADPYRGDNAHDLAHSNPYDPPRILERAVGLNTDAPVSVIQDSKAVELDTFPQMRILLENIHNYAHVYIGGTMGDQHTSFRDPFVFLLHSNVDRIFATWQLQPRNQWRLDPNRIYGSESDTKTTGLFPEAHIGITSPLEPWAGVNISGAEEGILETRPWA
ncbi:MAG: tyrosinase family protein, partial [Nitrososphaeraceae archaeon]